ncbi:hypothetical protein FWC31_00935 [Candidatus Saccharibacteria bacterium]|nr:hypothetical protein [Candidatus Saccharibacteria bacterium]
MKRATSTHQISRKGVFMRCAGGREFGIARNESIRLDITQGMADFALWGGDKFKEQGDGLSFEPVMPLDLWYALLIPKDIKVLPQFPRIATSYPKALTAFAIKCGLGLLPDNVIVRPGKIERYPVSGLADATFDLVATNSTAEANGLRVEIDERIVLGGLWKNPSYDAAAGSSLSK